MKDESSESNNDQIFAFLEILRILSDTKNFQQWLSTYHKIDDQRQFFEGYQYIITVSLQYLISELISYDPFLFKDDEKLTRANFLGITIENIPNSCEKTIVLKNIWKHGEKIRKAKTFEEIKNEKQFELVYLYEILRKRNLKSNTKIPKDKAILAITQFHAYLFLVDTKFGVPYAAQLASIFKLVKNPEYLDMVFDGYRYALEYLWFCLLGQTKFQQSCVKDLHRSDQMHFKKTDDVVHVKLGNENDFEIEEPQESKEEQKQREESYRIYDKWRTIDQFFNKIRSEIIRPLEAKIGRMDGFGQGFLKLENFDKKLFENLITEQVEDAPYMTKTDEKSLIKKIESELLWYPIHLLSTAETSTFPAAFLFIALLRGLADITSEQSDGAKIAVQIFKHPTHSVENGHDYSFGIKIGVSELLSVASSWLIFHNCTTDYSGAGGHYHKMCLKEIENHRQQNVVCVGQQVVDANIFRKFLTYKGISTNQEKIHHAYQKGNEPVAQILGKLLEYLAYKWLNDKKLFDKVQCDCIINDEQIDCFCESNGKIDHFECKLQLHNVSKTIKQIKRKHSKLKQKYQKKKVNANLIIYETVTSDVKNQLEKEGIRVHQNFKQIIEVDRIFEGSRRDLKHYFNLNSDYYDYLYAKD